MTYFIFALVFGLLAYKAYERSKGDVRLYSKIAALSLIIIALFFLYMGSYYLYVGSAIKNYYNAGYGVTYKYLYWNGTDNLTMSNTYYDQWDTRVGEYIAVQKADSDIITIISGLFPIFAILLGAYLLWYYVEEGLFQRKGDRVT